MYLLVIKGLDGLSLVRAGRIAECICWGIISCLICYLLPTSPIIEEILKLLPILVACHRRRLAFLSEAVLCGAASGAGFALLENILYVALDDGFTFVDALIRGFGTSLLHIGCTLLAACCAMLICRLARKWNIIARIAASLCGLLPSIALHLLYNGSFLRESLQMAILICIVTLAVAFLFELDRRLTDKWLDKCISTDISLLQSIRNGQLSETNEGQYLMMAKDRFQKEVFFDICVYLSLYLELSISAKSRMIMKDAGMNIRLSEEERKKNSDKITELKCLRKRIGKAGQIFLSPLVDPRAVDEWALEELL